MATPEQHKAAVRRLNAIWDGDTDVVDELVREDFVNHNPLVPSAPPGRDGFKQNVAALRAAFPDVEFSIEDVVAEGDKVAFRTVGTGTHEGELLGIPPTGRAVTFSGIVIFRFEGGQVAERWAQLDTLGLLRQLGAIPAFEDRPEGDP